MDLKNPVEVMMDGGNSKVAIKDGVTSSKLLMKAGVISNNKEEITDGVIISNNLMKVGEEIKAIKEEIKPVSSDMEDKWDGILA